MSIKLYKILGGISCEAESIEYVLKKPPNGNAVGIVIGLTIYACLFCRKF